jgi:hypothetical protein
MLTIQRMAAPHPLTSDVKWFVALLGFLSLEPAHAILFCDTGDASHHTAAPKGIDEDSGWQYQSIFGDNLGTAFGQHFFITAAHVTVESTFVQTSLFTDVPDMIYNVDSSAFSGLGYQDIAGTQEPVSRAPKAPSPSSLSAFIKRFICSCPRTRWNPCWAYNKPLASQRVAVSPSRGHRFTPWVL